jgi:hypothetical protein
MKTEATSPQSSVTSPIDTASYWIVMRIECEPHSSQGACWRHAVRSSCWCRAFLWKDRPAAMCWRSSLSRAPAAPSEQTHRCPSCSLWPLCFLAKSLFREYPSRMGCDAGSLLLCFLAFWRKAMPSSPRRPLGHRQNLDGQNPQENHGGNLNSPTVIC